MHNEGKHAYSPYCDCFRCIKLREGHKEEDVDAFIDGNMPVMKANVIYADFRKKPVRVHLY